jgi:hypothetical protein
MFNVKTPFMFAGAWAILKGFVDKTTSNKISVLGSSYEGELFK